MATHEEWQRAKDKRDRAARQTVQALVNGKNTEAMGFALASDEYDAEMLRISKILDGNTTEH